MSYSRTTYRRTTIGAAAFHFRVRNGNGWFHCAMITRGTRIFEWRFSNFDFSNRSSYPRSLWRPRLNCKKNRLPIDIRKSKIESALIL